MKQHLIKIQVFILFLLSITILMMGFSVDNKVYNLVNGMLFWLSFLLLILISIKINANRKMDRNFKKLYPRLKQLGVISFFKNQLAVVVDTVSVIALILLILSTFYMSFDILIYFILLSITIFAVGLHCIINGINYIYLKKCKEIKTENKRQRSVTRNRA